MRVAAVVVTYNRKKLLEECIEAILTQTYSVSKIIVIDNASTDGTGEMISSKGWVSSGLVRYERMKKNTGGAGGFYEGIRLAYSMNFDWIWVMDDDTIPTQTCLEQLVKYQKHIAEKKKEDDSKREIAYLASVVYGADGEYMNLPRIDTTPSTNGYASWYRFLDMGVVSISDATFVSILINSKAVQCCGLPCKEFFIWGDDTEYTTRLRVFFGDAYFVGSSVAIHKRLNAKALNILEENDPQRIKLYRYKYRNQQIVQRLYYGKQGYFFELLKVIISCTRLLKDKKGILRYKAIVQGYFESIIQYKKFKRYIDKQSAQE